MRYPPMIPRIVPQSREERKAGDCPKHRSWIRQQRCLVHGVDCGGQVQAAHMRKGAHAGMSQKPEDWFLVPLCRWHHGEQHRIGEESFAAKYGVDLQGEAAKLAARSPDDRVRA